MGDFDSAIVSTTDRGALDVECKHAQSRRRLLVLVEALSLELVLVDWNGLETAETMGK